MSLTNDQLLDRIQEIELLLNTMQTAMGNLSTRKELKNILAILNRDIITLREQLAQHTEASEAPLLIHEVDPDAHSELDSRYSPLSHVHDHGDLTGNEDDDHPQYHTDERAEAWLADLESGVMQHDHLSDLDLDDHTQYHNDTRGDLRYYTRTELDVILGDIEEALDIING